MMELFLLKIFTKNQITCVEPCYDVGNALKKKVLRSM